MTATLHTLPTVPRNPFSYLDLPRRSLREALTAWHHGQRMTVQDDGRRVPSIDADAADLVYVRLWLYCNTRDRMSNVVAFPRVIP